MFWWSPRTHCLNMATFEFFFPQNMANLLPFLSKKPFAHIPLDFIVLAAMWNFAQKNTAWNMYIYTNNKGSRCMKRGVFFFQVCLKRNEPNLARGHTGESRKKELEPYFVLATSKNSLSKYVDLWLFFPSKYGNFCAFMHWIFFWLRCKISPKK